MSSIRGTFLDGMIVPDSVTGWANGTRIVLALDGEVAPSRPEDDDSSPEAISQRLAQMDRVEPWMTPEEDEEWRRQRTEKKCEELANWNEWTKDIEKLTP